MRKKRTCPMGTRYLATLTLEEDNVIRKAANTLSIPRAVFVRMAAMKLAAECGYVPESENANAAQSQRQNIKSAWTDVME